MLALIETELYFDGMEELKRHAPFWIIIYLVWTYIKSNGGVNVGVYLIVNIFNIAIYMVAFYTLKHIYIPRLFNHKKYVLFVVSLIVTSFLLYLFMHLSEIVWLNELAGWKPVSMRFKYYLQKTIQYYSPAMILLAWELHIKSIKEQKRIQELENEKLMTELKFLKAQLNPHFLFNTLNNLYAQVLTQSKKAPDMILQLSGILDYVLYKSQKKSVQLKEEVEIIQHFLELEKIRFGDRLEVRLTIRGNLALPISPLLFLSLVENAVKHGVRKGIERAIVSIEIEGGSDAILCKVWNTKSVFHKIERDDHRKGLGLSNVKRQLKITYPDTHSIEIKEDDKSFCVLLTIKTES